MPFYAFCLVAVVVYHILPQRARPYWLLACSWFFYLCAGVEYFPFLLYIILVSYGTGLLMGKGRRKLVTALGVILCLGLLVVLKYTGFLASLVGEALTAAGLSFTSPALELLLPAGISFYIFQAVGYVVDVYRGKTGAQRNFFHHALFLSFFPQVLSGPIGRAPDLAPQLTLARRATWDELRGGAFRFLWGAFKKLVIADRLGILTGMVFAAPGEFGRLQLLGAAVAFSIQIYCDFSAYSDMALGVGKMLGVTLMENFRQPYFARSIQEFWRRWHISLSTWFRDYLYIPLGGSRRGTVRKWRNVLIVFALSGLWHGAALTFLVWGLLNGVYQIIGGWTSPVRAKVRGALHLKEDGKLTALWQIAVTFALSTAAWVFFKAPDLATAGAFLAGLFRGPWWVYTSMGLNRWDLLIAAAAVLVLLLGDCLERKKPLGERWVAGPLPVRWAVALALLLVTVVLGCYGPGYNAGDFIYFRF